MSDADAKLSDLEIGDLEPPKERRNDKSRDVDQFFGPSYLKDNKKYRDCLPCVFVSFFVDMLSNC